MYVTPYDSWYVGCETYSTYAEYEYGPTCGEHDDDDFTAADLCCACGGGLAAPTPAPTGSSAGMQCVPDGDECGQGLECVCAARRLRHLLFGYLPGVCTCQ